MGNLTVVAYKSIHMYVAVNNEQPLILFVYFDALLPSQQIFSHVR